MPTIVDLKEAKDLYDRSNNSKSKNFVLKEWNSICLSALEKTVFGGDVEKFFDIIKNNLPPSGKARDYAVESLDSMISMISNSKQAKIYYFKGKFYSSKILNKWNLLAEKELSEAKSLDQKIELLRCCFYDWTLDNMFSRELIKLINNCSSIEEIGYLCKEIYKMRGSSIPLEIMNLFNEKKHSFLLREIIVVEEISRIKYLYSLAPIGTAINLLIFEKWILLCRTPEEADEAFQVAPESFQNKAYNRIKELI